MSKSVTPCIEVGDDSVECRVLEAEALLAGAERAEVLGGLGHNVITELEKIQRTSSRFVV